MRRLLITGGSGTLGQPLIRHLRARLRVVATSHRQPIAGIETLPFDLATDDPRQLLEQVRPEVVLHTAAINPGQGTDDQMVKVNHLASRRLAEAASATGCRRLILVSTDVVHDGTAAPYADDTPATATSVYGRTKADGEAAALAVFPGALAVRTSLIYGLDTPDRGTAGFAQRLEAGEEVRLFSDVLRQPIWVETLARALVFLALDSNLGGILNVAGEQILSREAFGRALLRYWGFPADSERVVGVEARRVAPAVPRDLRLDLTRAHHHLPMALPGVDEVLSRQPRTARGIEERTP